VLTDPQSVNAVRDFAVLARLLDAWTEIGVLQRDAVLVAARGIDNLPGRDGAVGVNPVSPPPTEGGGRVGDLLAIALSRYGREFSHCEPGCTSYADFFWAAFTLAHRARCAAAIFLRAVADIVFFLGMLTTFCCPLFVRTLAHRALWAAAILALPAAEILA